LTVHGEQSSIHVGRLHAVRICMLQAAMVSATEHLTLLSEIELFVVTFLGIPQCEVPKTPNM
jgi:hypothetical protein